MKKRILKIDKNKIYVESNDPCKGCQGCGFLKKKEQETIIIKSNESYKYNIGEEIELTENKKNYFLGTVFLFFIPSLLILLSLFVLEKIDSYWTIFFIIFVIFFYFKIVIKKFSTHYLIYKIKK
jgi:hypothetical protein